MRESCQSSLVNEDLLDMANNLGTERDSRIFEEYDE